MKGVRLLVLHLRLHNDCDSINVRMVCPFRPDAAVRRILQPIGDFAIIVIDRLNEIPIHGPLPFLEVIPLVLIDDSLSLSK